MTGHRVISDWRSMCATITQYSTSIMTDDLIHAKRMIMRLCTYINYLKAKACISESHI